MYAKLAEMVQSGAIGKVTVPGPLRPTTWLPTGSAGCPTRTRRRAWTGTCGWARGPSGRSTANILPYKFRWWNLYSSQMANWGAHYLDAMRWILHETAPASIRAWRGLRRQRLPQHSRHRRGDLRARLGRLDVFSTFEASGQPLLSRGEIEFRGTLGTAYASMNRIEIIPERGGAFQDPKPRMKPIQVSNHDGYAELDNGHARTSSIASSRDSAPSATSRRAIAPRVMRTSPTSHWRPGLGSNGMPSRSASPTTTPPTSCSTTSTASRGRTSS